MYESNRDCAKNRGMCYYRTKDVETRINTGFLAVFYWTQFAQKHKIHSKKRSEFHSAFYFNWNKSHRCS